MNEKTTQTQDQDAPRKSGFLKKIMVGLIIIFLGLQLIPVDQSNPEVIADINAPDEVKSILRRACYDCHSNETIWPWYSHVAPMSWLVAKDVREGREYMNFSEWGDYYEAEETGEFFYDECWESIESGRMPLWFYIPLHPEANLTDADMQLLSKWCGIDESAEANADEESTDTETPEESSSEAE